MADLDPKKRIAQLVRMLGSNGGERRNAWTALEYAMRREGISWSDLGNWIEHGCDEGKYSEAEMLEFAQAARGEGIEVGIRLARAGNGGGNGHLTLPKPAEMAEFCHQRAGQLKDDKQRDFISDMYVITRRGTRLSSARLGYLVSIYIQIGGKT